MDVALKTLGDFAGKHPAREWLRSAVLFHQGGSLRRSGNLAAALANFRRVNARPTDRMLYLLNSHCLAGVLDELADHRGAWTELQCSLGTAGGEPHQTDLGILLFYFVLAERLG